MVVVFSKPRYCVVQYLDLGESKLSIHVHFNKGKNKCLGSHTSNACMTKLGIFGKVYFWIPYHFLNIYLWEIYCK